MYLNLNNNTFLKQIQAALSTLEEALKSGFEDFKVITITLQVIISYLLLNKLPNAVVV